MAYNTSKGARGLGDIKNEDDIDTQIDFDSDKITFKTNDVARVVIDNDHLSGSGALEIVGAAVLGSTLNVTGNVGIGTDSPDGKLHVWAASAGSVTVTGDQAKGIIVENDDSSAITLLDPSGGVIYFGDADDTDIGRIGYRHGGDYANSLYFTTNNAQRMTIDSSGKLGIGDPSPTHTLTVAGAISGSSTLEVVGNTTVGGNLFVSGSVSMGHGLAGDGALDIKLQNGNPQIIARYSTTHKTSLLTTSNGKFRIAPTGRTLEIDTVDTNGGNIHFTKNAASTVAGGIAWNTSNEDVTLYSEADLHLGGGGLSESMFTLDSTGKVGIGMDPTHLLTVAGAISGSSTLEVVGNTFVGGALNVTGASTFSSLTKTTAVSGSGGLQFVGPAILGNTLVVSGNVGSTPSLGLGTSTVHATENNYLSIANGTEPSFATADQISIGSKDSTGYGSGNGATFSMNTEGLIENSPLGNISVLTHRVSVWINGTEYFLYLDPV